MLSVGDVLKARYRIDSFLGRGGMADVYLAFDTRRQAYVALKVLREDLAEDPEFVRRFQREAEALARLDHPFVVRFYAFEVDGPVAFIVMDYVPGSTLRRRLSEARGPLPLDEVTHILRQVGAALQYAHNEGYIHRDVKPGNIMLREDGAALLSDFGIVRAAEATTMTMGPVGTPAYMSPEQIRGQEATAQTDIYSLGIVLFEMVTGRRPFSGEEGTGTNTIERVRYAHLHLNPPDPRSLNKELPQAASQVILRALAKEPGQRWPDVVSMVRAWEQALGLAHESVVGGRTAVMPSKPPTGRLSVREATPAAVQRGQPVVAQEVTAPPQLQARRPWLAVTAVLGVAIVALVALLMIMPPPSSKTTSNPTAAPVPTAPASTPSPLPTPDVNATAIAMVTQIARQTGEIETAVAKAVVETVKANTATAAVWATATVAAEQTSIAVRDATSTAEARRRTQEAASRSTQEAARNATATYEARRTATAAAQTATRAAQLALTAVVFSRQTEQARQLTAIAYQTSIARPRERCFEARLRHWEKSPAGAGEIAGIIYDRNGGRFSGAQVHLYIKASNWERYIQPAPDGIYMFCCLAFSMNNLHVIELTGNGIRTIRVYEFYINDLNRNKALVDFYEVSCP